MKKRINAAVGISLVFILLSGCSVNNKIFKEEDIVYSSSRYELKYNIKDKNRRSPLILFTQTILKEKSAQNEISYHVYDALNLSSSSYKMEEKVFLIIDNKPYPMDIEAIELENRTTQTENTESIMAADSTYRTVVTGYSQQHSKITKFQYPLSTDIMLKIRDADQIQFRYYAGPKMITVKPKRKNIRKIKELIDME